MRNPVTELFSNITDDELKLAIQEIKDSETDGIIQSDSVVRKYAKLINDINSAGVSTNLFLSQTCLLKEAAFRWEDVKNFSMDEKNELSDLLLGEWLKYFTDENTGTMEQYMLYQIKRFKKYNEKITSK